MDEADEGVMYVRDYCMYVSVCIESADDITCVTWSMLMYAAWHEAGHA